MNETVSIPSAAVSQPPIWRLRDHHYLNVPNTFYIKREVDGETQEMIEHKYPVPRLLRLDDPKACNAGDGVVLVSTDSQAKMINARMWIFDGEPTPDMEPQNDAAEAISAQFRPRWLKPFEELHATGGGSGNFAKDLENALARVLDSAAAGKSTPTSSEGILAEINAQMKQLMEQNAALSAKVAALEGDNAAPAPAAPARRA
jgi:hypothetical protein